MWQVEKRHYLPDRIASIQAALVSGGLAADFPVYNTEMGYQPAWVGSGNDDHSLQMGPRELARACCRSMILQIANGFQGCYLFGWDGGYNGEYKNGNANPWMQIEFAKMVDFLTGATLTSVTRAMDGRFVVVSGDGTLII